MANGLNSVVVNDSTATYGIKKSPRISLSPRRCLERGFQVRGGDVIAELRRRLIAEDERKHARTSRAVHALDIGHSIRVIVVTSGTSAVRKTREAGEGDQEQAPLHQSVRVLSLSFEMSVNMSVITTGVREEKGQAPLPGIRGRFLVLLFDMSVHWLDILLG